MVRSIGSPLGHNDAADLQLEQRWQPYSLATQRRDEVAPATSAPSWTPVTDTIVHGRHIAGRAAELMPSRGSCAASKEITTSGRGHRARREKSAYSRTVDPSHARCHAPIACSKSSTTRAKHRPGTRSASVTRTAPYTAPHSCSCRALAAPTSSGSDAARIRCGTGSWMARPALPLRWATQGGSRGRGTGQVGQERGEWACAAGAE